MSLGPYATFIVSSYAFGAVVVVALIAWVITHITWLGLSPWRWVFFFTGAFGLIWTLWWILDYYTPEKHSRLQPDEREQLRSVLERKDLPPPPKVPIAKLFCFQETWGVVCAKFLTDAAWYFYMFWLPKYLLDARGFDIKGVGRIAIVQDNAGACFGLMKPAPQQ